MKRTANNMQSNYDRQRVRRENDTASRSESGHAHTIVKPIKAETMKKFVVIQSGAGLWASPQILKARSFKSALSWCFSHGYDLIEEA